MIATTKKTDMETIQPVGLRLLVKKDDDKKTTKGGIVLPDSTAIPVITARVLGISPQVSVHSPEFAVREYDKVLVDPRNAIPVSFEVDNSQFLVHMDDIIGVVRK